MVGSGWIDSLPIWGIFVGSLLLVLLSIEGGYHFGRRRGRDNDEEKESPVGGMVAAALGLLALMLAFTFGLATTRFDARKQVLLDEANAIGTTYLRSGMVPERRAEIRALLREYVDARLDPVESGKIAEAIVRSERLHDELWKHAVALGERHPNSIVVGLFVESLNQVIDIHSKRVTVALRNPIPGIIWAALLAIAVLSLTAMGYHAGLYRASRTLAGSTLAISIAVVIGLIADLDRPREGLMVVSQQALIDLRAAMEKPGS